MKLQQFFLCALALIPVSFSVVATIDSQPAHASKQTNQQWKQYLSGRKIVYFHTYSSGYGGGGGITSKQEIHFCKNGQIIVGSQDSISVSAGTVSGHSNEQNGATGNWKIIESNQQSVVIEASDNNSQTGRFALAAGNDGKIYSNGNKFFPGPSNICP